MRLMENAEIAKLDVFGTKAKIMEENENETKYQMQCDTPNGFMHCYHLFPGIDLAYSTFEASSCRMRNCVGRISYCHFAWYLLWHLAGKDGTPQKYSCRKYFERSYSDSACGLSDYLYWYLGE